MLLSAASQTSPLNSSSLVGLDGSKRRVQSQLSVGSKYQNPVEVDQTKIYQPHIAFHGTNACHGSRKACNFGRPATMDS